NAKVLAAVATGAAGLVDQTADLPLLASDGSPNDAYEMRAQAIAEEAATRIETDVIGPRYAATADRQALPPLPGGRKADGFDTTPTASSDRSGGCAIAPAGDAPGAGDLSPLLLGAGALVATRRRRRS